MFVQAPGRELSCLCYIIRPSHVGNRSAALCPILYNLVIIPGWFERLAAVPQFGAFRSLKREAYGIINVMGNAGRSSTKPLTATRDRVGMVTGISCLMGCLFLLTGCGTATIPTPTIVPIIKTEIIPAPTFEPPAPSPTSTYIESPSPILGGVTPTPWPTWYPAAGLNGPPPPYWLEIDRVPPGKKEIAITFDAGGTGDTMPQILRTLREHHVHVTMFLTGRFAEKYSEGIKQAAADGHELANHTYSHVDARKLSDKALRQELARADRVIKNLTGLGTKPYWRPPFGSRNNHILNVAASEGYRSVYWTLDAHDAVGEPKSADFIFDRITNTPGVELDGAIILEHFGSQASADALPRVLDRLEEMGLKVVTISELLSAP